MRRIREALMKSARAGGERFCFQAMNCTFLDDNEIRIGDNVWISDGAIILPGVTIGDNVVIGAGSVVTKDIPSNVVAVGSPCKVLRENK